ncbi:MAG: amidohydrolase [Proteobacteria bacterium]|nr:amidohydrolase [Pseudomonadota bacterium]
MRRNAISIATGLAGTGLTLVALTGCGGSENRTPASSADLVLTNAKVVTVDSASTVAQAVAVKDGKVMYVGSSDAAMTHAGPSTKVVDLGGRTVVPGLADNHMHNEGGGPGMDLSKTRTMAELLAKVGDAARSAKPGDVLVSNADWHEAQLAEQRLPLATELETAAPGMPVVLVRGGHDYILNTTALAKWGISTSTPVPTGGAITRDSNGNLTGEIVDTAKALVTLPPAPPVTTADLVKTQQVLNAVGITSARVPGFYRGDIFTDYPLMKQLRDSGKLTIRYSVLMNAFNPDLEAFKAKVAAGGIKPGEGDEWVRVWGAKTGVDGGFEGGHMTVPYAEPYGKGGTFYGLQTVPNDKYDALVVGLNKLGWRVSTHAVGDAAVDQVLEAYEAANADKAIGQQGWAIEHAFITRPEQFPRMKALNLRLSLQDHLYLVAPILKNYWGAARAAQVTPAKAYADAGFQISGGTDTPVVPYSPFFAMYHFLTRDTISAGVYGADQALHSREQVLRMFTINYAQLTDETAIKGSIEPGKLADMVVLSADYMTIPDKQVEGLKALATYVGGKLVYQDPDFRL